jgi:hypothetical protein
MVFMIFVATHSNAKLALSLTTMVFLPGHR